MNFSQTLLSATSNASLRCPALCKLVLPPVLRILRLRLTAELVKFATDFEIAYRTDCWNRVAQHFAVDATYEVRNADFACMLEGRDAIVDGFKRSLDGFDRHLRRKMFVVEGPHEDSEQLSFVWFGRYTASNAPTLELSARQTLSFCDGKISSLVDEYLPGYGAKATSWIETHRPNLNPTYK